MINQRITNGYLNENVLSNLVTNRDKLIELQRKIASGKEIENASDNVFSATTILNSNFSLGKIDVYLKNINTAKSEIETADKALLTTLDSVHKSRELTIQALNATSGAEEMGIIGSQINQLLQQVKDIGNTQFGTKYIFGGQNTNSAPFSVPADGEIKYNGSSDGTPERDIEIAKSVTITMNIGGDELFGYYYEDPANPGTYLEQGLIGTLTTLKQELEGAQDKDVIRTKLEELDLELQGLLEAQSTFGGLLSRLEITQQLHKDDEINLTDVKSQVQDVDFAKTISDLQFQETALKASLQVSARVIQPSILNYL
ncbi:MAG TPA: flagellar hook-associated protein FlgL [Candidatus Gastranaerophilales bacterium]|nr:flagellar hook-associated protein FlgL [Candidatus Gastranaerophilales bacterium]